MTLNLSQERKEEYDCVAVENFREYLRIPSVHPDVDYSGCVKFLRKQAADIGLPIVIHEPVPKKPVVIITWEGENLDLQSILLNSHMDVVPVDRNGWTHDPFAAEMDDDGKIFGRGAQDMKNVAIQYLEAIRRLKDNGVRLQRTIHCSFVPDEEIGGVNGMGAFSQTKEFSDLKIGFSLDESCASPNDYFVLLNGERCMWNLTFHCPGTPGHGSLLYKDTAGEKMKVILNRIYEFRNEEIRKLKVNPNLKIGDVTTMNVTMISGGVQFNVLPSEFCISMDCRIAVTVNLKQLEERINGWCREAGQGVWVEKKHFDDIVPTTDVSSSNPYWVALKGVMDKLNYKVSTEICAGITDNRFIRKLGIPAFGISLMNNIPVLLHCNDEYIDRDLFIKGIEIYTELLPAVANVKNHRYCVEICIGITDSRYIRKLGIPALGFSPVKNVPALPHCNDEYLPKDVFLDGIEIYCELISALANV